MELELNQEQTALLQDFFTEVKNRINYTVTKDLNQRFCSFCKERNIPIADRELFIESFINGKSFAFTNENSEDVFSKLRKMSTFQKILELIKKATDEKTRVDILRKQVEELIGTEMFKTALLEELKNIIFGLNKNLKDDLWSQNSMINLFQEGTHWGIGYKKMLIAISQACITTNVQSIVEVVK